MLTVLIYFCGFAWSFFELRRIGMGVFFVWWGRSNVNKVLSFETKLGLKKIFWVEINSQEIVFFKLWFWWVWVWLFLQKSTYLYKIQKVNLFNSTLIQWIIEHFSYKTLYIILLLYKYLIVFIFHLKSSSVYN